MYLWFSKLDACAGQFVVQDLDGVGGMQTHWADWGRLNVDGQPNPGLVDAAYMTSFLQNGIGVYTVDSANTNATLSDTGLTAKYASSYSVSSGTPGTDGANTRTGNLTVSYSMQLSGANTSASVKADARSLLSLWDFNDLILFPITNSTWQGIMPLVTRNEVQGAVQPVAFMDDPGPYVCPSIGTLSADPTFGDGVVPGDVLGGPCLDCGDFGEDYFDARFLDYETPCSPPTDPNGWYVAQYGGWRSEAGQTLPPRATQWTNKWQASGLTLGRMSPRVR
jgi:hypothetical protein